MTFTRYIGWPIDRTWLSRGDKIPENFPEEFGVEDMEALELQGDIEGANRVALWREKWAELTADDPGRFSRSTKS